MRTEVEHRSACKGTTTATAAMEQGHVMKKSIVCLVGAGLGAAFAPADQASAQDRPLAAELEEVYRAGGLNAAEWAFFTDSGQVAFDAAGNLFVLDRAAGHVVVIDPQGRLARTIGRMGQGPGEFTMMMDLVVWRDGRAGVLDLGHFAIQIFTPEGGFERLVKMAGGRGPAAMFTGARTGLKADPLGNALIAPGPPAAMGRMAELIGDALGEDVEVPDAGVDERGLERLGLDGDVVSATPILQGWKVPREEAPELNVDDIEEFADGLMGGIRQLEPGFHWDLLPDGGVAYSDSSAYVIKLAGREGEESGVLRRPLSPEAVTERIREGTIAYTLRTLKEEFEKQSLDPELAGLLEGAADMMPDLMKTMQEQVEKQGFYHEVPVVRGVRATWEGALWVQRRGEEAWDDEGPIDVFGVDREYLGTLAAGAPGMPAAFGPDGLVAYWEFDEMDMPTIVVKRLPVEVR